MTTTIRKTARAERFKAAGPKGTFTALVARFGNVDLMGDRIVPGAFAEDLLSWQLSGAPIPMVFSHDWGSIDAHIGSWDPLLARETAEGLELTGKVDMDDPAAAKVFRLLAEGRVREFSFAYDVLDERPARDGANELVKLHVIEAGPTLKGANEETRLLEVKSALLARRADPPREPSGDESFEGIAALSDWLQRTSPEPADFRSELAAKFDKRLVDAVFSDSPEDRAAEAREAERARALAAFESENAALMLSGRLPSEAEREARLHGEADHDRRRQDAAASDRGGSIWSPEGTRP